MKAEYQSYLRDIQEFIPKDRIYTDELRRLVWGTDASFYRMIPEIVVRSKNEEEVSKLLKLADKHNLPVTFRAAGTSLCGQTVSNSIMIVAGKHWEKYEVAADASTITLEPGIIGERVNEILRPYGRMFGPDPASKRAAMVGGIIINNASGMNCGTHANSDKTLRSVRLVLQDGTIIDTGDEQSKADFRKSHPDFLHRIEELQKEVLADKELVDLINYKYSIKNVTGLNLAPFVRYTDVFDILTHLVVGSEGTLAFLSRATMSTEHLYKYSASAMLYFKDMKEACYAVLALKKGPAFSAEMLDKKSLSSVNDTTGVGLTALLAETKADTKEELQANIAELTKLLDPFDLVTPVYFTDNPEEYSKYWAIRSGIFPSVGGTRPLGTTVIIEDVAFHIEDLPNATMDLQQMLEAHGYPDACIYGHAFEGNYHFIIAQSFDTPKEMAKYKEMMHAVEDIVVNKYHGSLKAEHGTGRNMAPFVAKEWGEKAFSIMREVKDLFDPKGLLNPGVIFNDDPECYVKNIKPMPLTNPNVDRCIECGFCEVNCLTCGFSISSRQRIISQREISRLKMTGENPERLKQLEEEFEYLGEKTCAGDGLCSTSCPMKINTGIMIHDLREAHLPKGSFGYKVGDLVANHFPVVKSALRPALSMASMAQGVIGDKGVAVVGNALHKLGAPLWTPALPTAYYPHHLDTGNSDLKVVYFPSCINQTMGTAKKGVSKVPLIDETVALIKKAGYEVIFPEGKNKLCCGTIWESKGMPEIADRKAKELEDALIVASEGGRYPILCDQSPCLHRMRNVMKSLKLYEPVEFIYDFLAPRLVFKQTDEPIAIHSTCSTRHMGLDKKFYALASLCSSKVIVPEEVGCCGFAGDRGFSHPEVNRYALRKLRPQLEKAGVKRGFSNSRTCEIGLTVNGGVPYESIVYLVDECTEPKYKAK